MILESDSFDSVVAGCHPRVAKAIHALVESWGPYTTTSRRYRLDRLFGELIGPAWTAFILSLPARSIRRRLVSELDLSVAAKDLGFDGLRKLLLDVVGVVSPGMAYVSPQFYARYVQDPSGRRSVRPSGASCFSPTLDSLIRLLSHCQHKCPRTVRKDFINENRIQSVHCELCQAEAELYAFKHADAETRERVWAFKTKNAIPTLSARYCLAHRPVNHDGSWNAEYKRAKRAIHRFQVETERLNQQSKTVSEMIANSGSAAVDLFYRDVVQKHEIPSNEKEKETAVRALAVEIVRFRISDIKKFMVSMRTIGISQKEIGRRCSGMTQQSVSRALLSVPVTHRYDLNVRYASPKLQTLLMNDSAPPKLRIAGST